MAHLWSGSSPALATGDLPVLPVAGEHRVAPACPGDGRSPQRVSIWFWPRALESSKATHGENIFLKFTVEGELRRETGRKSRMSKALTSGRG